MPFLSRPVVTAAGLAALVSILDSASLAAQAPHGSSRSTAIARIDSIVNGALTPQVASYSVAVVRGRDTLLLKAYGAASLELGTPATPNTVYRIGSITKQFTAAAVMQLVEQGKLGLDDSLATHLPNTPAHWGAVKVRHLLSHTSGIPSYTEMGTRMRSVYLTGIPRDSLIGMLRGDSLLFAPGTGFFYNNTAYYLLGMIIERVSGKPYATYVADHLAKPLGLSRTAYCLNRPLIPDRASGYEPQDQTLVNGRVVDMDVPFAAGALCSTAGDLVAWARALASGRVVRPETYRQMITPARLPSIYPMTWGFGVNTDTAGTHRVLEHGGAIFGFAGQLSHYPDDSLFIAVLSNTASAPSGRVAADIARALLDIPRVPVSVRELPTSREERAALVGRYLLVQPDGSRREIAIVEQEGRLAVSFPGRPPLPLQRQDRHVFALVRDPASRIWIEMDGPRVRGLIIGQPGRPLPARRIP